MIFITMQNLTYFFKFKSTVKPLSKFESIFDFYERMYPVVKIKFTVKYLLHEPSVSLTIYGSLRRLILLFNFDSILVVLEYGS